MSALAKNDIETQTLRYQKLTKIAVNPKKDTPLTPFFSPMIKIDLSVYKKKKRKELMEQMRKNPDIYN